MPQWLPCAVLTISFLAPAGCSRNQRLTRQDGADEMRRIERQRVRALVDADMNSARRFHADDFQLITPDGSEYTKQTYLGQIESGQVDYKAWEPGEIRVRFYGNAAVIRYDDTRFEVYVNGRPARSGLLRHIDLYEKREGQWQVVWSQASGGQAAAQSLLSPRQETPNQRLHPTAATAEAPRPRVSRGR